MGSDDEPGLGISLELLSVDLDVPDEGGEGEGDWLGSWGFDGSDGEPKFSNQGRQREGEDLTGSEIKYNLLWTRLG